MSAVIDVLGWVVLVTLVDCVWIGVLALLPEPSRRRARWKGWAFFVIAGPVAWAVYAYERGEQRRTARTIRRSRGGEGRG